MASKEAREEAIRWAAEKVRNDTSGFLRRAGDPPPPRILCDCCEKPIIEYVNGPDGEAFCKDCVIALLGAERDVMRDILVDFVEWFDHIYSPENGKLPGVPLWSLSRRSKRALELSDE